jgi:endogenous inhibitor of DNA gyrase (YacG/DUF329 family)
MDAWQRLRNVISAFGERIDLEVNREVGVIDVRDDRCKRCGSLGRAGNPINHLGYCSRHCRKMDMPEARKIERRREIDDDHMRKQGWSGGGIEIDQ